MKIMLIGGGSGGHITPLLAVARELKALKPDITLIGVCEKNAKFVHLYEESPFIDGVEQISAGKYRRYSGLPLKEKLTDIKTPLLNVRDAGRTIKGYAQARRVLKRHKPDVMLIKGGFVAVPLGMAASRLGIPFLTHDSDSVPGLANRIVSRWASLHATGMPAELYAYPKDKIVYTGIPVSDTFALAGENIRKTFRAELGLGACHPVIAVTGGSQGGEQLNTDVVKATTELLTKFPDLGVLHIAGTVKEAQTKLDYQKSWPPDKQGQVIVKGFVGDLYKYSGAADVVVSRAGANATAELALQGVPLVIVPGRLADGHQDKNAKLFESKEAALIVPYGDAQKLSDALERLLSDTQLQKRLSENIRAFAKPEAAKELAVATLKLAEKQG